MPTTRKERIDFIRENSPKHRDTNFDDYDNTDILKLYLRIPLSPDKEKIRDKEDGIGFYWWKLLGDWMIRDNQPNWIRGTLIVIWILLNPLCMILYFCLGLLILFLILGHTHLNG